MEPSPERKKRTPAPPPAAKSKGQTLEEIVNRTKRLSELHPRLSKLRAMERLQQEVGQLQPEQAEAASAAFTQVREAQQKTRNRRLGLIVFLGGIGIGLGAWALWQDTTPFPDLDRGRVSRGAQRANWLILALFAAKWVFAALALAACGKGAQMMATGQGIKLPYWLIRKLGAVVRVDELAEEPLQRKRVDPSTLPSGKPPSDHS